MINDFLMEQIRTIEQNHAKEFEDISDFIFKNPELGLQEYIASEFLSQKISEYGFKVTKGICGIDTAFIAEFDNGPGPVIAYISEYDALPGFGPYGNPGHACGHNWIAATTYGAAITLYNMKNFFNGKILLVGCPAMENKGCKVDLIRNNVFDEVDVAIQCHLEKYTSITPTTCALDAIKFSFYGNSTHAAQHPEEGVNALDAARFTFSGMDALKNYLRQDINIHGTITDGGSNPTVIPDYAECRFEIRARDRTYLNKIRPRIIRCAEGAALMAGAKMTYENYINPLDNLIIPDVLSNLMKAYLDIENIKVSPEYQDTYFFGSTDIGNVSHVCPTIYSEIAMDINKELFTIHSNSAMNYVNSKYANDRLHQAVRIMSACGLEICLDKTLLRKIKNSHLKALNKSL